MLEISFALIVIGLISISDTTIGLYEQLVLGGIFYILASFGEINRTIKKNK